MALFGCYKYDPAAQMSALLLVLSLVVIALVFTLSRRAGQAYPFHVASINGIDVGVEAVVSLLAEGIHTMHLQVDMDD
jgi:hypothetical protein